MFFMQLSSRSTFCKNSIKKILFLVFFQFMPPILLGVLLFWVLLIFLTVDCFARKRREARTAQVKKYSPFKFQARKLLNSNLYLK